MSDRALLWVLVALGVGNLVAWVAFKRKIDKSLAPLKRFAKDVGL